MSITNNNGFQITPLVMAVCGALWGVLVIIGVAIYSKQGATDDKVGAVNQKLAAMEAANNYVRRDIDANTASIKSVSDRVTVLESKK